MAYTSRGSSAALRGGRNQASVKVSANTGTGAKVFSPAYPFSKTSEIDAREFVVKSEHGSGTDGEPMKIQNFSGSGGKGLASSMENGQFVGICNTGQTMLEILIQVQSYMTVGTGAVVAAGSNHLTRPYISMLLESGRFLTLPNIRSLIFHTEASANNPKSAAIGTQVTSSTGSNAAGSTDGKGFVSSTDYFHGLRGGGGGWAVTGGITPGSISINFYSAGYQELGMTNTTNKNAKQTPSSSTGLTANTAYEFDITVDGGTTRAVNFTTHTSDTTWGNGSTGNGVLKKINDSLKALHVAGSITSLAQARIVDGDIRFTSGSRLDSSAIALANASGSVANMFSVGSIPAIGNINSAVAAALETAAGLKREAGDVKHLIIDRGDGTGVRADGGSFKMIPDAGAYNYAASSVTIELRNCPKYADFVISYSHNASHSGEVLTDDTTGCAIRNIYARSVCTKADGKVKIFTVN